MAKKDPRVDAYIKKAQPFARPILIHIRKAVHAAVAGVDLLAALATNKRAQATFNNFPPGQRREYIAWIIEATQAATRENRIKTAMEWMAEGKPRNWKYM